MPLPSRFVEGTSRCFDIFRHICHGTGHLIAEAFSWFVATPKPGVPLTTVRPNDAFLDGPFDLFRILEEELCQSFCREIPSTVLHVL